MTRWALACFLALAGCGGPARFVAPVDDYASYRRVRLATSMGARLRAAQEYLERRPNGAFAGELRALFEREEPEFFEASKTSRARTLSYLAHLPNGPNAAAAQSLMAAWDTRIEEGEEASLIAQARRTEALLAGAALQRRQVGETIFEALRTISDPDGYGRALEDTPAALRRFLSGSGPTWGSMPKATTRDLFFVVPTRLERESRVATLTLALSLEGGRVRAATVSGANLFLHWLEADTMTPLDPTRAADRARAATHAKELLEGFFEARFPRERCASAVIAEKLLLFRECDGLRVEVTTGAVGEDDTVAITSDASRSAPRP